MFIVSQQRKKYTPEYRREAANLVIESERPIAHVAKEIGVSAGLLGRWVKLERERRGSSDGMSEADLRAENARLRRELAEAKMDNEFLSKATAFFALRQREQKVRIDAAGEGELQHQAHGTAIKSVSVWILQMGPCAAETTIRKG